MWFKYTINAYIYFYKRHIAIDLPQNIFVHFDHTCFFILAIFWSNSGSLVSRVSLQAMIKNIANAAAIQWKGKLVKTLWLSSSISFMECGIVILPALPKSQSDMWVKGFASIQDIQAATISQSKTLIVGNILITAKLLFFLFLLNHNPNTEKIVSTSKG